MTSLRAAAALALAASIVPVTTPGGNPVIEVAPLGLMPTSPLIVDSPVLVIAVAAEIPNLAALPRLTCAFPRMAKASAPARAIGTNMMLEERRGAELVERYGPRMKKLV